MPASKKESSTTVEQRLVITPPDLRVAEFDIVGTAPLVINKFSARERKRIEDDQAAGTQSRSKKKREPKDFDATFHEARHISEEGWDGIHAGAFRDACIAACRLAGFKMTHAKLSVFIVADGLDADEGTPLVRIIGDEPEKHMGAVRNQTGVVDLRARPMWRRWRMKLRVRFDQGQFSLQDVTNLLLRAGEQVGVGEGRPNSKSSNGMGWGTFTIAED